MNVAAEQHLSTAKRHITIAEARDAKKAAYEMAADEILAAKAEDSTLTQAEIGRQVGKSQDWVSRLLIWRNEEDRTDGPFVGQSDIRQRSYERKVPTRHDDRVEMARTLMADRKVVAAVIATPSPAARRIENAVHERETTRRQQERQAVQEARAADAAAAVPLPAYMARMIVRLNEWAAGLAELASDLDDLPDGPDRELLRDAAEELAKQALVWVERLDRPGVIVA